MTGNVVFEDGVRGVIEPERRAVGEETLHTCVRLEDGHRVFVPANLLISQMNGICAVSLRAADLPHAQGRELFLESPPSLEQIALEEKVVLPIVEEFASIEKKIVITGRVRVTKSVTEHEEVVDESLTRTNVDVERVPVGQFVDSMPEAHQEGNTLIIPVVEEVIVIEKRLMLVEEVRVSQRQSEFRAPQTVTLRREEVSLEHSVADE